MNIYVSNLGFNVREESLRELFTSFGEVSSAKIITDRETGNSRGFAFVEMPDTVQANKAIAELEGTSVDGRAIRVSEARAKDDRSSNGGYASKKKDFNNLW